MNTITVGGIAVIGMNTDNPDSFALVALENIPEGNMVQVTDNGWTTTGFRIEEGTLEFNVTADILAGTVWSYETDNTTTHTNDYGSWNLDTGFALSTRGDQIFVYTGDEASPNFIYGASKGWTTETTIDASSSQLPQQLMDANAYVDLGDVLNSKYAASSPHYGTKSDLLDDINEVANWEVSNVTRFDVHSFEEFNVIADETIDMVSESGIIAIILVCVLVIFGAILNEIVACKKEKSRKELLHKTDEDDESKL